MGIEKAKPKTANERTDLSDLVDIYEFPKGKWTSLRFLDTDPLCISNHWIDIVTKAGEKKRFPKICVSFDGKTEEDVDGVTCPYCEADIARSSTYYVNAIVRDIQEEEPAKHSKLRPGEEDTGFKEKGSKSWTPVRVIRLTSTLVAKLQGLADLNVHKIKGEKTPMPVSDNKYGMDISIKYDEKATNAANKYVINTGDKSPLTEDELEYLVYDLEDEDMLKKLGQETEAQAKQEAKRILANRSNHKDSDDEDEDDDYDLSSKKKKRFDDDEDEDDRPRKKSKSKSFDDDEDEDEDDAPKKKSKSKSKDFDDEDEDDRPRKKSKSKSFDDDEDEDEDDAPKKKSKSKSFDDDGDDDEDEDDRPRKKSKYDDDEDDEPKKKKGKSKKSFDDYDD